MGEIIIGGVGRTGARDVEIEVEIVVTILGEEILEMEGVRI